MKFLQNRTVQLSIIIFFTFLAYANIFQNSFLIDDKEFIVGWQATRSLGNAGQFLKGAVPPGHEGVYRPFRSLLYALSYKFWGLNTFGYHLQAIFIQILITVLIYLITERILIGKFFSLNSRDQAQKKIFNPLTLNFAPFFTALLFGLHPVHTEAITYMTASFDTFGTACFFAAFYFYLLSFKKSKIILSYYFASLFFALIAFFTYELTLVLPLLIIFYDFCFLKINWRIFLERAKKYYSGYFVILFSYLIPRFIFLGSKSRGAYLGGSFYFTMLTQVKVFLKYFELMLWPVNLSLIHVLPGGIPTIAGIEAPKKALFSQTPFEPSILAGLILLIGLIALIIKFRKKMPVYSFAFAWFLISLLPSSQIIPLQQVAGEKYLYIASFGLLFAAGVFISYLFAKPAFKNISLFIFMSFVLFLFILTVKRNREWQSELTVWLAASRVAPGSASGHYNLGNVYYNELHDDQKAAREYEAALSIDPQYTVAHNNLGWVYSNLKDYDNAENQFKEAVKEKNDFWPIHFGLAEIYKAKGKKIEAQTEYERVLKENPSFAPAKAGLADLSATKILATGAGYDLSFDYPDTWKKIKLSQEIILKSDDNFTIDFILIKRNSDQSVSSYLESQKDTFGNLITQGLAEIPGTDYAFVKIWRNREKQKMQFFLFYKEVVVKVLVYPADSSLMREFDKIVQSIQIKNSK